MKKDFITKKDYDAGFKRINIKFPLETVIKLNSLANKKGINTGTLAKMYVYEALKNTGEKATSVVLPGQTELFGSRNKKRKKTTKKKTKQ